jgi:hypothetical protein
MGPLGPAQRACLEQGLKKREKRAGDTEEESVETAEGQVLSRNDLLDRLIGTRDQKNKPA